MGNPKGFIKVKRDKTAYRPVCERVKDYDRVFELRSDENCREQASRCMDCGTPFCHWGCPIGNYIPEWNDLVFGGYWARALELLEATNNLPEITGRVCPALCESACVLGINDEPVTIREDELAIIEHGFKHNLLKPQPPARRTGKQIAVVGSGPAGLSCAAQLNRAGHSVTVFEKDEKIGGIMRFGIPDFKLEKSILDRRIKLWQAEGITFQPGAYIQDKSALQKYDAVVLAGGSRQPRDLPIPGRQFGGIYFAMDYLTQSNRFVDGNKLSIDAKGKRVVVIGGGDTGSDCVGTANRQGAVCVVQIELLAKPGEKRPTNQPWPFYPNVLKTTSSHEEGSDRKWSIATKEFLGRGAQVTGLKCVQVDEKLKEIPGTEFILEADLVFLALGFLHPVHDKLLIDLKIEFDQRGNVKTDANFQTSAKGVFAAGDMRRGQSLIVWAISEGRKTARAVDTWLMGNSELPAI
ncbi:glutamate synthase [candidate division WOR-1 bacterium RIFOXYB2_FULL_48_7]|uniref:Glutamate synthase n=1 Tax=candidate division WOR-1 bacterium RIFOXYB2_FULL_48_7 TaxID=1802583 RepID=A0A1F4TK33_UNCSA|nr:MAG: glutamate synthase [candidate division WOR-1 bacterium RIFOXYB2_FULL_48_7]